MPIGTVIRYPIHSLSGCGSIPQYGTVTRKGVLYYRTRILDADGKQVSLYGTTCEELYDKEQEARRQVAEIIFHREHPTVAEYCEKWLLMQSAKVSPATLKGYASNMKNYVTVVLRRPGQRYARHT